MNTEFFRDYCLQKKHVEESLPFDDTTLVFKLNKKIFALLSLKDEVKSCNLKCDPEKAMSLRANYSGIIPGYHMNKTHWNTRSEEHTSELQSRPHLVCRLLLDTKKQ